MFLRAAVRAKQDITAKDLNEQVEGREMLLWDHWRKSEDLAKLQFDHLVSVAKETEMTDFNEPGRQDVHEESADKLVGG